MIGVTPSFLTALASCGWQDNHLTDPSTGAARYPYVANTRTPGWSGQWAIGNAGDSISDATYTALAGARAITSGSQAGCYVTSAGTTYQLSVADGWALPSDPPPPPPP